MHDKCAVFGIYGQPDARLAAYDGLHMLNHRGPQSSGMVTVDSHTFYTHKGMGLVPEVYAAPAFEALIGSIAIGHNRYATKGPNDVMNAQPFIITAKNGTQFAIASNGDIPDYVGLCQLPKAQGYSVQSQNDGELIGWYIAMGLDEGLPFVDAMRQAMQALQDAAFSCVVCTADALYVMRDPNGFRPLCYGKLGDAYVIASETVAFDVLQARYIRDVEAGTIMRIDAQGEQTFPGLQASCLSRCEFELIYFARPDSKVFGLSVSETRKALGRALALYHPAEADLVIGVPDSGEHGAIGYHQASGLPYDKGFIRHHSANRQFILSQQSLRDLASKYKHNPDQAVVRGKRVVMVDDSIVRGTASRKLVRMLHNAGAREVHVRVASPPVIGPCFFGIDTPTLEELIANTKTVEEIRTYIEADSLAYLTLEQMHACIPLPSESLCSACFTRKYPVPLPADKQYALLAT